MAGLPKILLVEDNPQILELYTTTLQRYGYPLETTSLVDDALSKVKAFGPDIVFLDIMLPGDKSGLEALMKLRTEPQYGCTDKRIIMLTNLGLTDKLEQAWQEYADGYVVKADIVPHDLIEIIHSFDEHKASNPLPPEQI
jgi:CheY-like chemotaxis protein